MKNEYVYINGKILQAQRAKVSVFDRGLLYGDGLFETLKADRGRAEFLDEHMKRLEGGLATLGFGKKVFNELRRDIKRGVLERLLKKNELAGRQARLRITITRGAGGAGLTPARNISPTIIITAAPVDVSAIERNQRSGVRAATLRGLRPALPGVKTINFIPNIIGRVAAKKLGALEGIFIGDDQKVLEGTASNIFMVKDGEILTAPAGVGLTPGGVLPGITRGVIIGLARERDIPIHEEFFSLKNILKREETNEVFMTGSVSGVVPVISVDSRPVGTGRPGPVTRLMQRLYKLKAAAV